MGALLSTPLANNVSRGSTKPFRLCFCIRKNVNHVRRTIEATNFALIPLLMSEVRNAAHVFVNLPKDSRIHPAPQARNVFVAQEWFTKTGNVKTRQQTHINLIEML